MKKSSASYGIILNLKPLLRIEGIYPQQCSRFSTGQQVPDPCPPDLGLSALHTCVLLLRRGPLANRCGQGHSGSSKVLLGHRPVLLPKNYDNDSGRAPRLSCQLKGLLSPCPLPGFPENPQPCIPARYECVSYSSSSLKTRALFGG